VTAAARIGLLVMLAAGIGCSGTPLPGTRRSCLLPLGDSVTQGSHLQISYRYWLWGELQKAGIETNFVGSLQDNYLGPPPSPTDPYDRDHEGHWGWRADEVLKDLPTWLKGYDPGVVLLHLGTNDCWQGQSPESTLAELGAIVDALRARSPRVAVLIAKLLPMEDPTPDACIGRLNAQMAGLAASKVTTDSPVVVVDQNGGFDVKTDTYDGVHPNEAGERKMARRWQEAAAPFLAAARSCR
jgi:acyl-CoA thioesterase I